MLTTGRTDPKAGVNHGRNSVNPHFRLARGATRWLIRWLSDPGTVHVKPLLPRPPARLRRPTDALGRVPLTCRPVPHLHRPRHVEKRQVVGSVIPVRVYCAHRPSHRMSTRRSCYRRVYDPEVKRRDALAVQMCRPPVSPRDRQRRANPHQRHMSQDMGGTRPGSTTRTTAERPDASGVVGHNRSIAAAMSDTFCTSRSLPGMRRKPWCS